MSLIKTYLHWVESEESQEVFSKLPKKEVWVPVKDFPGYEVSDFGRVRSYHNNKWGLSDTPKLLTQHQDKKGYWKVRLKRKNKLTHRVVCESFRPNPDNLPCVLHGDSDPSNPHLSNLRWGTHSDNTRQGVEEGSVRPDLSRKVKLEKLTTYVFQNKEGKVVVIKNITKWLEDNNHPPKSGNLYQVIKGKRPSSYGLKPLFTPL